MVRFAALAVVLAGCDAVFGLADVTDPALIVDGSFRVRYVTNDASFAPVVGEKIYAPGTVALVATLDNGTQPIVTYNDDGTFWFARERADQPYRLSVKLDVTSLVIEQHAPRLDLVGQLAGRPDRLPVLGTTVSFGYPLMTEVSQGAYVMSTGVYTQTYTGQWGPTVRFDWRLSTPLSGGSLGLLEAAKHDQIFAARMDVDSSNPQRPYTTLYAASSASITQLPGVTTPIPDPQPVTRNTCARFASANVAQYERLVAATPREYIGSLGDWYVFMAPAPDTLSTTGMAWVVAASYQPLADLDVAPTFYDPFVGMTMLVESGAVGYFNIQLPGAMPLQYGNVLRVYAPADRGDPTACSPAKTLLASTVGIPSHMILDGTPLDTDGKPVALDLSRDVPLSWTTSVGPVDFYAVSVQEVQNVNGATTTIARHTVSVGGQTTAFIDHTVFEPGKTYIIAVNAVVGRPNVAAGDWGTVQMPLENATVWSQYFEVQPR